MVKKQLWVLAGANGSGKSTFYKNFLAGRQLPLVNADLIAQAIDPQAPAAVSYQAAARAEVIRRQLLESGVSFCFETVFSHPSKIDFVAQAKALGYEIVLVYLHLALPDLNVARVAQRVEEGGHAVPIDKIKARIPRTLDHVKQALPLADQVILLDNSSADDPFRPVAHLLGGVVATRTRKQPAWARQLLG